VIQAKAATPTQHILQATCCPRCQHTLDVDPKSHELQCTACRQRYGIDNGIPLLYWPTEWGGDKHDVTAEVQQFYEATPFPNYDDFDSAHSLVVKAEQGMFAKLLDQQLPNRARVLEVGCGTGQLSNFLSIAGRSVIGTDLCLNSLRLGNDFARKNGLSGVQFVQSNIFRPAFRPETFDVVISNGVLHHTADPFLAFETISRYVKPGGYILVGLYHKYGRLITDARRLIFRLTGDRFTFLDPNLRAIRTSKQKKRAWFMDQYKHPHESKHTIGETLEWLKRTGLEFVKSIPRFIPMQPFSPNEPLFRKEEPGTPFERMLSELMEIPKGSREGGFFIVIARKPPAGVRAESR
jgi:SAM-dependent methyltransferase